MQGMEFSWSANWGPRDAHPARGRRNPLDEFYCLCPESGSWFPERKLQQDKKSIIHSRLGPPPKARVKEVKREGWLAPCPLGSASSSGKGMESDCLGVRSPGLCCYFDGISDSSLTSLGRCWDRFCDSKLYSKEP